MTTPDWIYWAIAAPLTLAGLSVASGSASTRLSPDAPIVVLADGSVIGGRGARDTDASRFKREVVDCFGVDRLVGCDGRMVAVCAMEDSFFLIHDWTRPEERSGPYRGSPRAYLEYGYLVVSRPGGDILFDTTTSREMPLPAEFIALAAVERGVLVGIGMDDWRQGRTVVCVLDAVDDAIRQRTRLEYDCGGMYTRLDAVPGGRYFLFSSSEGRTICSTLDGEIRDEFDAVLLSRAIVGRGRFAMSDGQAVQVDEDGHFRALMRLYLWPDGASPDPTWFSALGQQEGWGKDAPHAVYLVHAADRVRRWKIPGRVAVWLMADQGR